jgi:integrase
MNLTDTAIKNFKPTLKQVKLTDGGGLYILITPSGGKLWRFDYRFAGDRKTLAIGAYPTISLKDARLQHKEAQLLLANGKDPGELKKIQKAAIKGAVASSFEAVAREWYEIWKKKVSPGTSSRQLSCLERNVFPLIGAMPVAEIKRKHALEVLRAIEARGVLNTVPKAKTAISYVMQYAIRSERAENDPTTNILEDIERPPVQHFAAITSPTEVGLLLRSIDQYKGQPEVCAALKLAPLLFARIGELRTARWADIDLENAEWCYTVSKTKTDHLVPLAQQSVEILKWLRPISGHKEFVFPGLVPGKPISNSTINQALQRMGYNTKTEMTGHGFRAMARTLLAEKLLFPPEIIEHQLAHKVPGALGEAYNRAKFIQQRREMMQKWADYLDQLKKVFSGSSQIASAKERVA